MANVISLAEVKRKRILAQYMKFYGTAHDNTRKTSKEAAK